jgi:carboxypeptidase C (cathepsin A)
MKKLHKENGKEVSKKIYQLADTIMETSYTATHMMSEKSKINLLVDNTNLTKEQVKQHDMEMINMMVASEIATNTWTNGWYSDLDVCVDCLIEYFVNWGFE